MIFSTCCLPVVLQQNWANSFGRMRHIDGSVKPNHLRHERQRPTMVQMKMRYEYTVNVPVQTGIADVSEIWESSVIVETHMHSTV